MTSSISQSAASRSVGLPPSFFHEARIALAFDLENHSDVFKWASEFQGLPIVIKLGLGILPTLNARDLEQLKKLGYDLFIDVKLHDIPSQVSRAVRRWADMGANFITLHTSGASQMISEAVAVSANYSDLHLLGVTALTSLSQKNYEEIGWLGDVQVQVDRLCQLGLASGLYGFVSPARQVPRIKSLANEKFKNKKILSCTPGVTLPGDRPHFDQAQSVGLEEALQCGSDLIVIGRSIMKAENPREKCELALDLVRQFKKSSPKKGL